MSPPPSPPNPLAPRAREQFVAEAEAALMAAMREVGSRLAELQQHAGSARDAQDARDAQQAFSRLGSDWVGASSRAWRVSLRASAGATVTRLSTEGLSLIDDSVVERKIMSSRLALMVAERANWELNDLRVRMKHLEGDAAPSPDVLWPEPLFLLMVEQWDKVGLDHALWKSVQEVISKVFLDALPGAYKRTNDFLVSQGVMREIDFSTGVRRGASSPVGRGSASPTSAEAKPGTAVPATGGSSVGDQWPGAAGGDRSSYSAAAGATALPADGFARQDRGPVNSPGRRRPGSGWVSDGTGAGNGTHHEPVNAHQSAATVSAGPEMSGLAEANPVARARARATGVLGQLRRLLTDKVSGFAPVGPAQPSPALYEALQGNAATGASGSRAAEHADGGSSQDEAVYDDAGVHRVAGRLRSQTAELKRKAVTQGEKATIEIVALMFQSILGEDRIPPSIRVWFARLQMPVLRVALSEPEFFESIEHPARQLIDRMGSCVLGFDSAAIGGSELETEVKRVVQTIEQYPETGRRVFQLVYDEFERFLGRFLTQGGHTQKLVTVAQQVEQRETLTVQYTIELRKLLDGMPVRDEIREFLFKTWAEVLALAGVRHGPQHEETLALKAAASDMIWAASAKPNRRDRARVIQDLPRLLQRLRAGMALIGMEPAAQESQVKLIAATLADAFMSKTEAIAQDRLDEVSRRLERMEDHMVDTTDAELHLDAGAVDLMLGVDATNIEVVSGGGSRPTAAMQAWATELRVGQWFSLDHNGKTTSVQYAWCSHRKHLHLFASGAGRSYLFQARRLAAYLQAGLLVPNESEGLTVRATRAALAKLDANPERLLAS